MKLVNENGEDVITAIIYFFLGLFITCAFWAWFEPILQGWLETCWLSRKMDEINQRQKKEIEAIRVDIESLEQL
jgi:hypothetical protein